MESQNFIAEDIQKRIEELTIAAKKLDMAGNISEAVNYMLKVWDLEVQLKRYSSYFSLFSCGLLTTF